MSLFLFFFFFFNDTATTEIYTLSLHDALPISLAVLETASAGQEGVATAAMQLANVLSIALGTGLGGVLIAASNARTGATTAGLLAQSLLMIGVIVAALLTALRLPGRPALNDAQPVQEQPTTA